MNYARLLGCSVLSALDAHGFELVGSIDMSTGGSSNDNYGECELNELLQGRGIDPKWTPGSLPTN